MKIFVTGGSGFVGTHLIAHLLSKGNEVVSVGRRAQFDEIQHQRFTYISADTRDPGDWQQDLPSADAVINLSGKNLFGRWTKSYKKEMYDSRVRTTEHVVEALPENYQGVLISASAAGFYGDRGDTLLDENADRGEGFLSDICRDWEAAAAGAEKKGARVVIARFGIVLGREGGALEKMIPAYRLFLGGSLGDGSQWFPWIHIEDLLRAMEFAIAHPQITGAANFSAPNPVRYKELADALGRRLHRPTFMPAPAFMLKLALGELGSSLLASTRMIPSRLLGAGFKFKYPDIDTALKALIQS